MFISFISHDFIIALNNLDMGFKLGCKLVSLLTVLFESLLHIQFHQVQLICRRQNLQVLLYFSEINLIGFRVDLHL